VDRRQNSLFSTRSIEPDNLCTFVSSPLLATAFSASDEDLLRGRTVAISQIGASLPISFTFAIAPFVFVFLHIYTLARYDMLAANVRQFLAELAQWVPLGTNRERCRQLLANVEFILALVAPPCSRLYSWVWRWLFRVVIVAFPIFVLLLVQINALRYQSELITWVQRTWLFADLGALIWFFYRNRLRAPEVRRERTLRRVGRWASVLWLRAIVTGGPVYRKVLERFCPPADAILGWMRRSGSLLRTRVAPLGRFVYCTGQGGLRLATEKINRSIEQWGHRVGTLVAVLGRTVLEWLGLAAKRIRGPIERWARLLWLPAAVIALNLVYLNVVPPNADPAFVRSSALPEATWGYLTRALHQPLDVVLCPLLKWGCRYLTVDHRTLIGHVWKAEAIAELRAGQGDLDKLLAKIEGVYLRGRSLRFANLNESRLYAVDMIDADLSGATLVRTQAQGARGWRADLSGADLSGANLSKADLNGALLSHANLSAADLSGANLFATYIGALSAEEFYLHVHLLQPTNELHGWRLMAWPPPNLPAAQLAGANLSGAHLTFADLTETDLYHVNLSGADLSETQGLTPHQLDEACGDSNTKLPASMTVRPCTERSGPTPPPPFPIAH
jgi:uncharacterized protein YjbI with pentapeptide repeats